MSIPVKSGNSLTIFCTAPLFELATTIPFSAIFFGIIPIDALFQYLVSSEPFTYFVDNLAISYDCSTTNSAKMSFNKVVLPVPGGPFTLRIRSLSYPIAKLTATCCINVREYSGLLGNSLDLTLLSKLTRSFLLFKI